MYMLLSSFHCVNYLRQLHMYTVNFVRDQIYMLYARKNVDNMPIGWQFDGLKYLDFT